MENNEIKQLQLEAAEEERAAVNFDDDHSLSSEQQGSSEPEREPDQEIIKHLNSAIGVLCGLFAPNWNVQAEEVQAVAVAGEAVLDKYMPNAKSALGCELTLLLAVGGLAAPRLAEGLPRKIEEPAENKPISEEKNINPTQDRQTDQTMADLAAFHQNKEGLINEQ